MAPAKDWAALVGSVALERDRDAFAQIFDFFVPRLEAYLMRTGLDRASAEEITQDTMVALWRKASLFDPAKSSLSTWLYRIARNRRIDLGRKSRIDYVDPTSSEVLEIAQEDRIEGIMDGQQRDDVVRALMADLPPEQLSLVQLAFYESQSHAQIASRTGLPLGTVKSRLRLAFSRLRRKLEEAGISEAR